VDQLPKTARLTSLPMTVGMIDEVEMKSTVVKRSVLIAGHKTSVSIEEPFWKAVREIAALRNKTLSGLVEEIDTDRKQGNLSSAIRLFVLDYYKSRI
jgi:predicted DNA-binding ribbon-helix-helix protein